MLDNFVDCEDPIYGRTGILLSASAGGMKALNEFFPSIADISDGVILVTGILGAVLIIFKIMSVRANIKSTKADTKLKNMEIEKKMKELDPNA